MLGKGLGITVQFASVPITLYLIIIPVGFLSSQDCNSRVKLEYVDLTSVNSYSFDGRESFKNVNCSCDAGNRYGSFKNASCSCDDY